MSTRAPGPGSFERSSRRLRRRFIAGFAVAAALVLVITGSSILELRRAQILERDESQHDQLMQTLGSLQASFVRKSAAFRGYLLLGRPTFLEEAAAARREFLDRLVWLRRVTSDARSDELIRRLLASEAAHQKAWDLRLTSTTAESPPIDPEYFLQTISPRATEVIRDIRALTAHQTRMLEAVHRSAEKRLFRTALTVLAGGGGALLLTIVLTGFLARRLTDLYEQEQAARRQAEDTAEALQRREKELQAVFEGSLDPMVIADDTGRFVEANPAACELFGLPCEQLLGKSIREFAEAGYPFEEMWKEFRELGAARGEFRLTRPDGSIRDTEFSATADVQPGRHLSALRDVTERKDAEAALRQSESRKAAIFSSSLDAIITMDASGRVMEFNRTAEAVFGYARQEAVGREMAELIIPPALRASHREGLRRHLASGEGVVLGRRLEMPAVRRDGTEFPVELSILRLPGEGPPVFTGFLRDITERRQAEAERMNLLDLERKARTAAEAAEGRYAFLAEASALLAASMDWETTLKRVSRLAVPRIADWCVVDILEDGVLKPLSVSHVDQSKVELVHEIWLRFPRDQNAKAGPAHVARTGRSELTEQVSDEMLRSVSRNEEHFEMVRRLRLASSVCVPLEARGQILGALTFAFETGGRRYGPDDVTFAESLAHHASLAIDNARLFRQAHEAIRLRDEFLSIASHELKTPVTTLRLQIESLMRHLPQEVEDATGPRLSTTRRQVDRLQKLIERLLDISRLTGGRLELDLEPVNLDGVVRDVVGRFEEELRQAGCPVTVRGSDPRSGHWDRSRLDQVVTNLLSNAIKYGSGQAIEITLDGDERTARLEVRDHGIGIPTDRLPHIFERFERAVSERHYGGLGLGLWIVRQIVDAFGGSVRALSAPGEGSTFIVELPRTPPRQDAS